MRRFWLVPAMLAGAVLHAGIDPDSGLRTWWQLRGELEASRERADAHRAEIERLRVAADSLAGAFELETAIREDTGLAQPGDIIVQYGGSETSSPWNP